MIHYTGSNGHEQKRQHCYEAARQTVGRLRHALYKTEPQEQKNEAQSRGRHRKTRRNQVNRKS
jgi:hypothetical protein